LTAERFGKWLCLVSLVMIAWMCWVFVDWSDLNNLIVRMF